MVIDGKNFPLVIVERPGFWVKFESWSDELNWDMVTEEDMVQVAEWCKSNDCGTRMSYDMFQFRNRKELEFFMLRWQ